VEIVRFVKFSDWTTMNRTIVVGTRGSKLALTQADIVKKLLLEKHPTLNIEQKIIMTKGDIVLDVALSKIGDKGLFVRELETALLKREIDIAVHSYKDLQTENPKGLIVAAVPERENPFDVLLSKKGLKLNNLPEGALIATSSIRRRAQLLSYRPDLKIIDIRGNIETRIKKFLNSEMHGLILAAAGLIRLGLQKYIQEIIDHNIMLPAPAQGAIAIQIRDDSDIKNLVQKINHTDTFQAVIMERAFLQTFKGGCQSPISAFCERISDQLFLKGRISNLDGSKVLTATIPVEPNDSQHTGILLAHKMLEMGAAKILEENHEE